MELDVLTIVASVLPFILRSSPVPQHDSALTGDMNYKEVMRSPNVNRFLNVTLMDKDTFVKLKHFLCLRGNLRRSISVTVGQKVLLSIHVLIGHSNRQIAERWQHSGSTISLIIHEVSDAFRYCSALIFVLHLVGDPVPSKIAMDPTFTFFFDNCIGALDGVHISAFVQSVKNHVFRDRKKNISQNVLGAVNFDMTFSYVLTGWEGSTHDGRVLEDAKTKGFSNIPGKYFLGDAGYALSRACLTPYRGVRYHLKEFQAGNAGVL